MTTTLTLTKTFTVVYNPKRDWDNMAWSQVKVSGANYADMQDKAHEAAKEIGNRNGYFSWRLEYRNPFNKNIRRMIKRVD